MVKLIVHLIGKWCFNMKRGGIIFKKSGKCIGICVDDNTVVTATFGKIIKVSTNRFNGKYNIGEITKAKGYRLSRILKYIEKKAVVNNNLFLVIDELAITNLIKEAALCVKINLKDDLYKCVDIKEKK